MGEPPEPVAKKPIVMIAEDEPLVRMALTEHLSDCGFEVISCSSGQEARVIFLSGRIIDLLFSDINMPGPRDGLELALWVGANYPSTQVVLTSGVGTVLTAAREACSNVRHFINKPYRHSEVERLLRAVATAD